jgi:hypothetical protein
MNIGNAEIPNKLENPFLRAPDSPFYIRQPLKPGASTADLVHRLKASLAQMSKLCFDKEATLRPSEIWPSEPWLDELSEIIWRLSSLHRRGGKDLWSCIKAIDNRYRTLKLSGKIERLVDRAGKLYCEPLAIAIQRRAIPGNQAAHRCFAALERCHDGKSTFASEDWEQFREILQPRSDETCEAKALQILADWLLDDQSPQKPWDPLASWLSTMGNASLAAKVMRPDPAAFCAAVFESRPKVLAARRQKAYRRRKNHPIRLSLMRILSTPAKPSRAVRAKK